MKTILISAVSSRSQRGYHDVTSLGYIFPLFYEVTTRARRTLWRWQAERRGRREKNVQFYKNKATKMVKREQNFRYHCSVLQEKVVVFIYSIYYSIFYWNKERMRTFIGFFAVFFATSLKRPTSKEGRQEESYSID